MTENVKIAKSNLVGLRTTKENITGKILLEVMEEREVSITQLVLIRRNTLNREQRVIPIEIEGNGNIKFLDFTINAKEIEWKPFYWDAFVEIHDDNKHHLIRIKISSSKLRVKMNALPSFNSIHVNKDYHLYPYVTTYGSFSLTYKQRMFYETKFYFLKWCLALLIYLLFKPYWDSRKIWLGFEKNSNTAQDNGFSFFNYCYEQNKHSNFFYVIRKNSPDIQNTVGVRDKIVFHMSIKYMIYLFSSKLLISSETKGHVYDIRIQNGIMRKIINGKKQVFLQHGVIGLKRVDKILHKKTNNRVDLFITSSEYERNIIVSEFGYRKNEVVVTGLSRWDQLINRANGKKVLFMPSWRSWIDDISDEEFIKTDYYRNYSKLLSSKELGWILSKYDLKSVFFLHPKLTQYVGHFKNLNKRVSVQSIGEYSMQKELMEASIVVTDYSSVSWDMYFLKKPVIFYQFDQENYLEQQGSYLDFKEDLFGDLALDTKTLIRLLDEYANNDFREKEFFAAKRKIFFKYADRKNSERIFNAIKRKFTSSI
ncbi:MAG: CDP-glycerol glycerophosphotransferase family protein [Bacillota bacterium]